MSIETVDRDELERRLRAAQRPVVVDFFQDGCAPCHALDARLAKVVPAYRDRLEFVRVDLDRDMPVARTHRVQSLPTLLIVRGGQEIDRLDGLVRPDDLVAAFDHAVAASEPAEGSPLRRGSSR